MNPVKASPATDPNELIARFKIRAAQHGFREEQFGQVGGYPLLAWTKRAPGPKSRIYLSSGIHGDEPAGPRALLQLLETGFFDDRAVWFLCPVLNPIGLSRGTRENGDQVDLNRDYRGVQRASEVQDHIRWLQSQPNFDLVICLHEDWESVGFYLYERNPDESNGVAEAMIRAVSPICPIEQAEMIDGRPAKGGIIRGLENAIHHERWAEAVYLWVNHARLCYTTESPSALPLEQRVAAHCTAVQVAIGHLVDHASPEKDSMGDDRTTKEGSPPCEP